MSAQKGVQMAEQVTKKKSKLRETIEGIITALLIAGFLRAFVFEAYKIPTGSMIPTLLPGDHIFVNKFVYGPRIPFTKFRLFNVKMPERGDVAVFLYPQDESINFIKRIIGMPGDTIMVKDNNVFINGDKLEHTVLNVKKESEEKILSTDHPKFSKIDLIPGWQDYEYFVEKTGEIEHPAQYLKFYNSSRETYQAVVPPNHYFVMGDNRDDSRDSREWGFVPFDNVKGKAMFIWMPWDKFYGGIRWRDFGKWIK